MDDSKYEKIGLAIDVLAFMVLLPSTVILLAIYPYFAKLQISPYPYNLLVFVINLAVWSRILHDRRPVILGIFVKKFDGSGPLPDSLIKGRKKQRT